MIYATYLKKLGVVEPFIKVGEERRDGWDA